MTLRVTKIYLYITQWAKSKIHSYRLLFRRFCPLVGSYLSFRWT